MSAHARTNENANMRFVYRRVDHSTLDRNYGQSAAAPQSLESAPTAVVILLMNLMLASCLHSTSLNQWMSRKPSMCRGNPWFYRAHGLQSIVINHRRLSLSRLTCLTKVWYVEQIHLYTYMCIHVHYNDLQVIHVNKCICGSCVIRMTSYDHTRGHQSCGRELTSSVVFLHVQFEIVEKFFPDLQPSLMNIAEFSAPIVLKAVPPSRWQLEGLRPPKRLAAQRSVLPDPHWEAGPSDALGRFASSRNRDFVKDMV